MSLLPPTVSEPISECNGSVIVSGQRVGATISIFSGTTHIGGDVAFWGTQLHQLPFPLNPGDLVFATQTLDGETSPDVPQEDRVQVQPVPADMSSAYVHMYSHVYRCGQCLRVCSAVPGARVEILANAVQRGADTATHGFAHIDLSPATDNGDVLQVKQIACGVEGPTLEVPAESLNVPNEKPNLPRPKISKALRACDRAITVTNLVPGAHVIIERSSGPTHHGCSPVGTWSAVGIPELQEGETVTVHQEFLACKVKSDTAEVIVEAATPVPVPVVSSPICEGTTKVRVRQLRPGALIRILVDGNVVGEANASSTTEVFQLGNGVSAGNRITASQNVCDNWSDQSEAVVVSSAPSSITKPSIPGPLNACASAIYVENLTPGAKVIFRDGVTRVPRSASQLVWSTAAVIGVDPALMPGEKIILSMDSCGAHADSEPMTVEPVMDQFRPPQIGVPVFTNASWLPIYNTIPGATVEIAINEVWTYAIVATRTSLTAQVDPLPESTGIRVRQRICATVSPASSRVVVRPRGPRIITESPLPDGEKGIPYSIQIEATGGVEPFHWDTSGGLVPGGLSLDPGTGILSGTPEFGGPYEFTIEVEDNGEPPVGDEKSFEITMEDGSPTPTNRRSRVDFYNCHTDHRTVRIWTNDLTAGTGWQEDGSLDAQYDASGCPAVGAMPYRVVLEDGDTYQIRAIDPGALTCSGNNPEEGGCIRWDLGGTVVGDDTGVVETFRID